VRCRHSYPKNNPFHPPLPAAGTPLKSMHGGGLRQSPQRAKSVARERLDTYSIRACTPLRPLLLSASMEHDPWPMRRWRDTRCFEAVIHSPGNSRTKERQGGKQSKVARLHVHSHPHSKGAATRLPLRARGDGLGPSDETCRPAAEWQAIFLGTTEPRAARALLGSRPRRQKIADP
jgi:hypothetical protein